MEGTDPEGLFRGARMGLLRMYSTFGSVFGYEQTSVARRNVDETCRYIIRFGCVFEACPLRKNCSSRRCRSIFDCEELLHFGSECRRDISTKPPSMP